jgi:hypothetical protein
MNDLPDDFTPIQHPSRIDESRRRRRRKLLIPPGKAEKALYLDEIARRLVPGVEFFVFSLTAGLVISLGILLDSPAIYILGALLAPFMIPVVGLGFSTAIGSFGFFLRSTVSLVIGSLLVFAAGALGGWISRLFTDLPLTHAYNFTSFTVPDFILLTIGAGLAIYMTVRAPKQRSLVASVPLAYEIYIPVAVAGFGITSKAPGLFPEGLKIAGIYIAWIILVGILLLAILKLRPASFFGYLLTAVVIGAAVYLLVISSALGSALEKQVAPFITKTPKPIITVIEPTLTPTFAIETPAVPATTEPPLPTSTLQPSRTPTITITPKPTPVWAKVFSPTYNGVMVRKSPGFAGEYLTSLLNGAPVQVLPDTQLVDNVYWAHVLLEDGTEGWMALNLLQTATPVPNW